VLAGAIELLLPDTADVPEIVGARHRRAVELDATHRARDTKSLTERRTQSGKAVGSGQAPLPEYTYRAEPHGNTNESGFQVVAPSGAPLSWYKTEDEAQAEVERKAASQPRDVVRALARLDTSLFEYVRSQTCERDRQSLLALHHACAKQYRFFSYLEIGSHLGGTLQVLIRDPRCTSITSIDPRPLAQPDVRGVFEYPGNSTERMISRLESVPGADIAKLQTIEATSDQIRTDSLVASPQLCLIDGEHTIDAALCDARFCRQAVREDGAIVFHDRTLVLPAIERFLEELNGLRHDGYPLRGKHLRGRTWPDTSSPDAPGPVGRTRRSRDPTADG
jgi:hypothetical protein